MNIWSRFRYFNIAFYAAVMGFGGFALATHKLEQVYHTEPHFSLYLLWFALLLFVWVTILYIIKIILNFNDVRSDFFHTVKSNFFPGIWKILMIFSIWFLSINTTFALFCWLSGIFIQVIFSVILFRRWMLHDMEVTTMNPLRFLPVVGNILAPVAWVQLWFQELSWFLFAAGMGMRIILFVVIMNRIIFHVSLPQKLFPTLIILIAPPAVASIAYTALHQGVVDDFGKALYYFSLFLFLIVLSKINILSQLKFFMSRWAYSFPLAVLTTASLLRYSKLHYMFLNYISLSLFWLLLVIMCILIYQTLLGIFKRELCVEE